LQTTIYNTLHDYFLSPDSPKELIPQITDIKTVCVKDGMFSIVYSTYIETTTLIHRFFSKLYEWIFGSAENVIQDPFETEIILVEDTVRKIQTKVSREELHYKKIEGGELDAYFTPKFDSLSFDTYHLIAVDLPGFSQDEVHISCMNNKMGISGVRVVPKEYKGNLLPEMFKPASNGRRFSNFNLKITFPEKYICPKEKSLQNGELILKCPLGENNDEL